MVVKRKFFFAWHEDKEIEYLNRMSEQGLQLVKYNLFKYTFEEREERNFYQFDFRTFDNVSDEEYLQLYEDGGMDFVCKYGGWYIFSSKDEEVKKIYNDNASLRERYKRILLFLALTGFPLYYQVLILYPSLTLESKIYSVVRIILTVLLPIHLFVVVRFLAMYRKTFNKISE